MKYWIGAILLAAVSMAVGAAATATADGKARPLLRSLGHFLAPPDRPPAPAERSPGPGRPEDRAPDQLADAFDSILTAGLCLQGDGGASGKEMTPLLDSAKEFYRTAHKAFEDKDENRAAETALAARDAAQGVIHYLKANAGKQAGIPLPPVVPHPQPPPPPPGVRDGPPPPPPPGVRDGPEGFQADRNPPPADRPAPPPLGGRDGPPPPRGDRDGPPATRADRDGPPPGGPGLPRTPDEEAKAVIRQVGEHLEGEPNDAKGPAKAFLDAAHKALDQAQKAQKDGDPFKAVELARAAGAWSHVVEHLQHADQPANDRPPPHDGPRPPRPDERKDGPPRPPLDEER